MFKQQQQRQQQQKKNKQTKEWRDTNQAFFPMGLADFFLHIFLENNVSSFAERLITCL